jgi:hypothetical protein
VFWVEENWNQDQYGLYGQKFSPQGDRLWTDSGQEFIGLGNSQIWYVCSAPADTGIYVGYFESPTVINTAVKAFRIDPDGAMLWRPRFLSVAELGNKDDLLVVVNTENRAFLTWSDNRNGDADIYAQNVNLDGTLGNPPSGVDKTTSLSPMYFRLYPAYPNPFNPTTTLSFALPAPSWVSLTIYDITGRLVATVANGHYETGSYRIPFDGSGLASGIYFYRLKAGAFTDTKKLVLMK